MLLPALVMAACAVPLALGPDRASARAWVPLGATVGAMLWAATAETASAHLLGALVALLSAPVAVVALPRDRRMAGLHRGIAAPVTAWCLISGAGAASAAEHHGGVAAGPVLAVVYAVAALAAVAHRGRGAWPLRGEAALMTLGVVAMAWPA